MNRDVQQLERRAEQAIRSGNRQLALDCWLAIVQREPGHLGALGGVVDTALLGNNEREVRRHLLAAVAAGAFSSETANWVERVDRFATQFPTPATAQALQEMAAIVDASSILGPLAQVYLAVGDWAGAEEVLDQLISKVPASPHHRLARARARYRRHDFSGARADLDSLTSGECSDAAVWHQLGQVQRAVGEFDQAASSYAQALASNPAHPGGIWFDLARITPPSSEISTGLRRDIAGFVENSNVPEPDVAMAHYALAKLADDAGDYRTAFSSARRANAIIYPRLALTLADVEADIEIWREIQSDEGIRAIPAGSESSVPVFVIGAPRSGTTLLEKRLSDHRDVVGIGERALFLDCFNEIGWEPFPRPGAAPRPPGADQTSALASAYLSRLKTLGGGHRRIVDKMPDNAYLLGMIAAIFPNATIVNVRRHPLDICLSIFFQAFDANRRYYCHLEEVAQYLKHYITLNAHFAALLNSRLIECRYEKLVCDTDSESRRIIKASGLSWDDGAGETHIERRGDGVLTASDWQVRQPIHQRSVNRWQNYRAELEPAAAILAEEIVCYEGR